MRLRGFFPFYGSKWRLGPTYPSPLHDTIVEPFAGSACYSLTYPDYKVVLVERDPRVAATWRYLLNVSPAEILALPDIAEGQTTDDLDVCDAARLLIGWWLQPASAGGPSKSPSGWMLSDPGGGRYWGGKVRRRIASQLGRIKHWTLIEGDCMQDAPDIEATWFVDPPYEVAGKHYTFGSKLLDYTALGSWCRARQGQTIVCENVGADWLPFQLWASSSGKKRRSMEVVWLNSFHPD